jgi:PAS domain S-box-containing protein
MDIDLGEGMDGTEVARAILQDHDIPVVFLSSHIEKEVVEKTEKITSYGYVVKNTGITVLDASIKMAFKLFEAHSSISRQKIEIVAFNEHLQAAYEEMEAANEELIRSENELLMSESRYRLLFNNMTAGFALHEIVCDNNGLPVDYRFIDVNPAFEKLTGLIASEVINKTAKDVLPNIEDFWIQTYGKVALTGKPVSFFNYSQALGKHYDVWAFSPEKGRFAVVFSDITERIRAEYEVGRLSRIYEVISQINQLIVHARTRDAILEGACRITVETGELQMAWIGFVDEAEQVVKPACWYGVEEGYLSKIKKISISDIPEGRGPTGTAIRDGRFFCCNDIENDPCMAVWREEALKRGYRASIALPLSYNGRITGTFNIYAPDANYFSEPEIRLLEEVTSDLSFALEMVDAEEKRKKAEEMYRLIAENSSDTIWVMTPDGRLTYHSPAVKKLRGYTPEEANELTMGKTLTPDSLALIIRLMSEDNLRPPALRQNEYLLELEMYRKDGSTVWTEVSVHVLRDAEGNITGFQGGSRDVTERRRAEAELQRLLTEKDILMKELQHRIKNNLKVISGLLAFESDRINGNSNSEIFQNAISRIESMAVIYESLYLSDNIAEVELHNYIKYLADSIFTTYNIQPAKINLTTSLDEISLDLKRSVPLGLVLNELITNSLKYAYPYESGGNIMVALSKDGGKVTLIVEDNGAGFPSDFKEDKNRSMGLRLVKMLTEQIGGELDINSRAGAKVSVSFML